jgi:hypothetical protein
MRLNRLFETNQTGWAGCENDSDLQESLLFKFLLFRSYTEREEVLVLTMRTRLSFKPECPQKVKKK